MGTMFSVRTVRGLQRAKQRLGPCVAQGHHWARIYRVDQGDRTVAEIYAPENSFGFGVPDIAVVQRVRVKDSTDEGGFYAQDAPQAAHVHIV